MRLLVGDCGCCFACAGWFAAFGNLWVCGFSGLVACDFGRLCFVVLVGLRICSGVGVGHIWCCCLLSCWVRFADWCCLSVCMIVVVSHFAACSWCLFGVFMIVYYS